MLVTTEMCVRKCIFIGKGTLCSTGDSWLLIKKFACVPTTRRYTVGVGAVGVQEKKTKVIIENWLCPWL